MSVFNVSGEFQNSSGRVVMLIPNSNVKRIVVGYEVVQLRFDVVRVESHLDTGSRKQ